MCSELNDTKNVRIPFVEVLLTYCKFVGRYITRCISMMT